VLEFINKFGTTRRSIAVINRPFKEISLKNCSNCKAAVLDTAKFCPKCGSNAFQSEVEQVAPAASSPASPPPRAPVAPPRFTREPVKPAVEEPPPPLFAPQVVVEDAPIFAPKTVEVKKSDSPAKTGGTPSGNKKGGSMGIIIVGVIGLVAVGGYFLFSKKDAPSAVVSPTPTQSQAAPPVQPTPTAPGPVTPAPAKPAPATPKVMVPKSNPGPSSPAPSSTPATPDINKIMKDAASK